MGMLFILIIALTFPFLPFLFFSIKFKKHEARFLGGAFSVLLYWLFVGVPYHFQGYADIADPSTTTEPIGITKFILVDYFDYIYVSVGFGYWWLLVSLFFVADGGFKSKNFTLFFRFLFLCLISFMFYSLKDYQRTIGIILE